MQYRPVADTHVADKRPVVNNSFVCFDISMIIAEDKIFSLRLKYYSDFPINLIDRYYFGNSLRYTGGFT